MDQYILQIQDSQTNYKNNDGKKNPESLNKLKNGLNLGLSIRQLDQLKTCLEAIEKMSAEKHATLSKHYKKKHIQ